jgi:hypothetical protein
MAASQDIARQQNIVAFNISCVAAAIDVIVLTCDYADTDTGFRQRINEIERICCSFVPGFHPVLHFAVTL